MHQLRVLIWKAYKVRLRTPLATLLDVTGPIMVMLVYLGMKLVFGAVPLKPDAAVASESLFRQTQVALLDPRTDLQLHICTKVLFYAPAGGRAEDRPQQRLQQPRLQSIRATLPGICGIQLIDMPSRQELVNKLESTLERRIRFRRRGLNLNRPNSSQLVAGCFTLPGEREPCYQAGIVVGGSGGGAATSFEIYLTDTAQNPVIYQPYTQGSSYHEFRLPHSDLNSGLHLLQLCLANTLDYSRRPPTGGGGGGGGGGSNSTTPTPSEGAAQEERSAINSAGIKLRIRASPVIAAPVIVPTLLIVFLLLAHLFNALAATMRTCEENESGLHQYIRTSGVPAGIYWLGQISIVLIHMAVQCLLMAVVLAIPTSDHLFDPIYEANITMRYLLILTYGFAISTHAIFIGSLLSRSSHSVLVFSLLALIYCLSPISFFMQWNAYGFVGINKFIEFTILNPVTNYMTLLSVIIAVCAQTAEPLNWGQMNMRIIGGGISDWSIGSLWMLLVAQAFVWFLLIIVVDQIRLCSSRRPLGWLLEMTNEMFFCNTFGPKLKIDNNDHLQADGQQHASKSSSAGPIKSGASMKDPNRICCSVKRVSVEGPTLMLAHTKGDPLRASSQSNKKASSLSSSSSSEQHQQQSNTRLQHERGHLPHKEQANLHHQHGSRPLGSHVSKTHQFLINRNRAPSSAGSGNPPTSQQSASLGTSTAAEAIEPVTTLAANNGKQQRSEQPVYLYEAIQQHIVWYETQLSFSNLSLDFRYNQVSFILGQTDLKDLLFASLLGLRSLDSGYIVLDGARFSANKISLARPHIGYLGERDIFNQEMSIFENLQFFGSLRDPSYTHFDSESQFVLNLLHLSSRKDNLPQVLTSRSARKLALAAAAVGHTKLLLLVEPTLNLRWKPRCQVLNLLKKYKAIRSIVVDTSDIDEAVAFGDRLVLLRNGRTDLDGAPERLSRKLCCGYWLVFEPVSTMTHPHSDEARQAAAGADSAPPEALGGNIRALDALLSGLFKQDKLDRLDSTKRSVYQELLLGSGAEPKDGNVERRVPAGEPATVCGVGNSQPRALPSREQLHKQTVIVKVQYSSRSSQALCSALKMFPAGKQLHGFRLAEITFESLEDIMVLRMSKAVYPELPPDLLLSLQHRTQANCRASTAAERTQSQVSVRKFTSELRVPKVSKPMFGARMLSIAKDRLTMAREMTITGVVFLIALLLVAAHLWALRASLEPELSKLTEANWLSQLDNRSARQKQQRQVRQWQVAPLSLPIVAGTPKILDSPPPPPPPAPRPPIQAEQNTSRSQLPSTASTKPNGSAAPISSSWADKADSSTTPATNNASASDGAIDGDDINDYNYDYGDIHVPDDASRPVPTPMPPAPAPQPSTARVAVAGVKEISLVEKLYENRMAFYVIAGNGVGRRQAGSSDHDVSDNIVSVGSSSSASRHPIGRFGQSPPTWPSNSKLAAAADGGRVGGRAADGPNIYFEHWQGNKRLTGIIARNSNESDAMFVANLIQKSKDLLASIIVLDPGSGEATIVFEPHAPHAMIASIQRYINYYFTFNLDSSGRSLFPGALEAPESANRPPARIETIGGRDEIAKSNRSNRAPAQLRVLQHNFQQSWHEMLRGHLDRRFFYGLGFTIAEGLTIGALVMAPIRHRSESRVTRVPTTYWIAMGLFDMVLSLILVTAYTIIIVAFEGTSSSYLIFWILFTLTLYKFASIPLAYLISLLVETAIGGFLFVFLITFAIGWAFGIQVKSFIEWTLSGEGYIYTVSSWIIHFFPISSLIEAMSNINQINRINELCTEVPAYTQTISPVKLDGYNKPHLVDRLLVVVRDCLANGKTGVLVGVFSRESPFTIIWVVILMMLFALVTWTFLFFSERVFGVFARRFSSGRSTNDPMKTIIRPPTTDSAVSSFVWDQEKDRLVSEYIRCMNETRYVKQMVTNCYYLRIWLRPLSDQSTMDKRLALLLEPLINLGQPKNELQVELKTTLQLFVRIGNESSRHKLDRIQIIESYSKFVEEHSDMIVKFALVDWTREALYRILLHGYYNTKSKTPLL